MKHDIFDNGRKEPLAIEETEKTFSYWHSRPFVSENLLSQISPANVLIVPLENHRDETFPVFPSGTEQLYAWLRENSSSGVALEICINDQDYIELALHADLKRIGFFVATLAVAPILTSLLSTYIYEQWVKSKPDTQVKCEITVAEESGRGIRFNYEGPGKDFEPIMQKNIESLLLPKKAPSTSIVHSKKKGKTKTKKKKKRNKK